MKSRWHLLLSEGIALLHLKLNAKHFGAYKYDICGLSVICKFKTKALVEDAVSKINDFNPEIFGDLVDRINLMVFVPSVEESDLLLLKRAIIISEKDKSHTATSTHLAGWLLYYFELIKGLEKSRNLKDYKEEYIERGNILRNRFLRGKDQSFDVGVEENPSTNPPPRGAEAGGGSESSNP